MIRDGFPFKDPMFHITTSLATIAAGEKIISSNNLTDDEKTILLKALLETIATDLASLPAHATVAGNALSRMIANDDRRNHAPGAKAQKQGRKAKGIEDSAQVDAGRLEEGPEAPSGQAEGIEGPPEVIGSNDRAEPSS